MSQRSTRHAALVGLFVSAGFAIFVATLLAVGNLADGLSRRTEVTASFPTVEGLKQGDAVWFSGVPVGMVKRVRLATGGGVEVQLAVDRAAAGHIPSDVVAKLSSDGLIGNRIVVLGDGEKPPPLVDGQTVKVGATLSAEQLMEEVKETNEKLRVVADDLIVVMDKVKAGEGTLGRFVVDDALFEEATVAVRDLQGAARRAESLAHHGAVFAQGLNDEGTLVHDLVHDRTTYAALTSGATSFQEAAANLKAATEDPTTPAGVLLHDVEAGGDLAATFANAETSSELLVEDLEAVQHNFLLRPFFKKQERQEKRRQRKEAKQRD